MCDNTLTHVALKTQAFLTKRNVDLVKQPTYSPDLNLCDRYLLRNVTNILRSHYFEGHEHVKDSLQRVANSLSKDDLYQTPATEETPSSLHGSN